MIPIVEELISEQNALFIVASARGHTRTIADIVQRNDTLTRALDGWTAMITRVIDLYNNAETSKSIRPFTNLVPESLLVDSNGQDNVNFIDGNRAPNSNELRDISAISFVGGGSVVTYNEGERQYQRELSGSGSSKETVKERSRSIEFFSAQSRYFFGLKLTSIDTSESESQDGVETSVQSGRFFRLSDPNDGDSFDVKVFIEIAASYSFARSSEIRSSTLLSS